MSDPNVERSRGSVDARRIARIALWALPAGRRTVAALPPCTAKPAWSPYAAWPPATPESLGELDSDIVKVKVCGILDVEIDVTGVASIAAIPALSPLATHATLAAGAGGQVSVPVSSVLRFPPLGLQRRLSAHGHRCRHVR